ncbi:BrnA antitoxin family protein [Candidatus Microgenomates bacterium]|nr:BrnA antitoxin family protein [Candidatus Microgenomates bacterium]
MKQLKTIPHFKNEAEERKFWQTHDSTEYVDYSSVKNVKFPNLKLTSKPITIRLPQTLIERLKIAANKMDVPYQALIKKLLFEGMAK